MLKGEAEAKAKTMRRFLVHAPPGHMAGGGGRVRENYVCLAFLLWGGWGAGGRGGGEGVYVCGVVEWGAGGFSVGVGEVREHISAAPSHATYISSFRN